MGRPLRDTGQFHLCTKHGAKAQRHSPRLAPTQDNGEFRGPSTLHRNDGSGMRCVGIDRACAGTTVNQRGRPARTPSEDAAVGCTNTAFSLLVPPFALRSLRCFLPAAVFSLRCRTAKETKPSLNKLFRWYTSVLCAS